MAMQAASPAAVLPSAQVVGNVFVEHYYHILHQSPELVYKFYQDSSILSRPESDGTMSSVTTMEAINEKIQSLDYKNYKAEIITADAQDSYQAGVIVLVTGCLTGKDNVRKKFAQTFFLSPQEKGYFVQNDVFRYLVEVAPLETHPVPINDVSDSAPLTVNQEPACIPDDSTNERSTTFEPEDLRNGPEVCDPSDNREGSALDGEVIGGSPDQSSLNETAIVRQDPSADQEKKSYASIVKVTKATKTSVSGHGPTSNMRWAPANNNQQAHATAKPSPEQVTGPTIDAAPESSNVHEEVVEGHSIYIRNLPMNASVPQLEEEFKSFGPIKSGGVQVRSNKQHGFCFGFVEFESLDSMQNAIKASPIIMGNRQVVIEEKRTTTRVGSSGRGRYPSGRGGFLRNANFRGRGNFGGRGYGRNEFRHPSGDFSTRPSRGYQRVDQNGGGKFARAANKASSQPAE